MCQSIWSVVGCAIGAVIAVWLIALILTFRKKRELLREEGLLWNYFFLACGAGGMVVSFDYLSKVVFKQGAFPPRPEDVLYGFLFLFALKMMVDSAVFIRKVRAKYTKTPDNPEE